VSTVLLNTTNATFAGNAATKTLLLDIADVLRRNNLPIPEKFEVCACVRVRACVCGWVSGSWGGGGWGGRWKASSTLHHTASQAME
jgi:hypothetical protein